MKKIEETLQERAKEHGSFEKVCNLTQALKKAVSNADNDIELQAQHVEALNMIFLKIARMVLGNPNNPDHAHDIAGYATLLEKFLRKKTAKPEKCCDYFSEETGGHNGVICGKKAYENHMSEVRAVAIENEMGHVQMHNLRQALTALLVRNKTRSEKDIMDFLASEIREIKK